MSATLPFDTLAFAKKLKSGGVPSAQAETHADALGKTLKKLDKHVATKSDVDEVATKVEHAETTLRRDIKVAKLQLTIVLGVLLAAGIGLLATLIKVG